MKRMTIVTLTAVLALNTFGQDLPMLRSKDAMRTFAIEQSAFANAQISTSLPAGNNSYGWVPIVSPTAEGISNTIRSIALAFDAANPNDPYFTSADAYNSDYDPLFTGSHQFNLVQAPTPTGSPTKWALPPDYGDITLTLYDNIPIKIAGAQSAIIAILGPDGKTQREYSLDARNSKVYFPWKLCGQQLGGTNAIMGVYTNGASSGWAYWNINSGSSIQQQHFNVTVKAGIQGIVSFTDTNVYVAVPTTNSVGFNVTAELKSTKTQQLPVSFWTTEGKWFVGAWVRKTGTSQWQPYTPVGDKNRGMMIINLPTQTGIYYVVPVWNTGDLIEPPDPYYPPYNGGGMG